MTRFALMTMAVAIVTVPTLAAEQFAGKWVNVDDQTQGVTRLEITKTKEGLFLRAWGAIGVGGENDLGKVPLKLLADNAG